MEFIDFQKNDENIYELEGYGIATLDVAYDTKSDKNKLDIYLPTIKQEKYPVIIFIHGGGYVKSDKRRHTANVLNALQLGYAVVGLNYRLAPEAVYPAFLEDCLKGLTFLGQHADQYKIDKDKMILWGETHGALLACQLGIKHHRTENYSIVGVISFYAPIDLHELHFRQAKAGKLSQVDGFFMDELTFGAQGNELLEKLKMANPLPAITGDEPAFFLNHGTLDDEIPIDFTHTFAKALQVKGVSCTVNIVEGGKHGMDYYASQERNEPVMTFIKEAFEIGVEV